MFVAYYELQILHLCEVYGFSPVCLSIWYFKGLICVHPDWHLLHLYGFPQYECAYSVSTRCSVNIYDHNAGIYVHIYLGLLSYFW